MGECLSPFVACHLLCQEIRVLSFTPIETKTEKVLLGASNRATYSEDNVVARISQVHYCSLNVCFILVQPQDCRRKIVQSELLAGLPSDQTKKCHSFRKMPRII